MTAAEIVQLRGIRALRPGATEEPAWTAAMRLDLSSGAREERYLVWFGGLIAVVLVVAALVVVVSSQGRLSAGTASRLCCGLIARGFNSAT